MEAVLTVAELEQMKVESIHQAFEGSEMLTTLGDKRGHKTTPYSIVAHPGVAALAGELVGDHPARVIQHSTRGDDAHPPYQPPQSHCQEAQNSISSKTGSRPSRSLAARFKIARCCC